MKESKEKLESELMIKNQLLSRGFNDSAVMEVMRRVPRHLFVRESDQDRAYKDYPLPIGHEQTISQPYIVALMTSLLSLNENHTVLEIGTGSGYQTAILAEIAKTVYTIENIEDLSDNASKILLKMNYKNILCKVGDGFKGWKEYSPYDRIIVTAAPTQIPSDLLDQLRDGGRMVIPIGEFDQMLTLVIKQGLTYLEEPIIPVRFVPMTSGIQ